MKSMVHIKSCRWTAVQIYELQDLGPADMHPLQIMRNTSHMHAPV